MLHNKFQGNQPSISGEEDFFKCFYHICALWPSWSGDLDPLKSTVSRMLYIKFDWNWPSGFRGEVVWKSWWRQWITVYTISSPGPFGPSELKNEITRVIFLVCNTSSRYDATICEVSQIYSKWLRSYGLGVMTCTQILDKGSETLHIGASYQDVVS